MFNRCEYNKKYKKEHTKETKEYNKKYYSINREIISLKAKKRREKNSEQAKKRDKEIYHLNPEKARERVIRWRIKNNDKYKESSKKTDKKRRATPKGKLNILIGNAIRISLRTGKYKRHWEGLVGYSIEKLKKHIEKQFQEGMSWENYGKWHIDHIIPVSAFNFETPEDIDFKRCWALKNLQPLWAKDNLIKHDNLNQPFQPSLLIAV